MRPNDASRESLFCHRPPFRPPALAAPVRNFVCAPPPARQVFRLALTILESPRNFDSPPQKLPPEDTTRLSTCDNYFCDCSPLRCSLDLLGTPTCNLFRNSRLISYPVTSPIPKFYSVPLVSLKLSTVQHERSGHRPRYPQHCDSSR